MLWKLFGLQRLLDELFNEVWLRLDLPPPDGWLDEDTPLPPQD